MTNIVNIDDDSLEQYQLDLFSLVDPPSKQLINGKYIVSSYSNSIGSIDLIPRFKRGIHSVIPTSKITRGKNLILENPYQVGKNQLICRVKPALIKRKIKGTSDEFEEFYAWPGDKEETLEKILFLIASNKGLQVIHSVAGVPRYGIYFTLYEIREELKKIGKTRSYDVIREALIIIRDSNTSICQVDGKREVSITHDIFADAVLEVYGTGRGRDRCCVSFSDYIVSEIQGLNYRMYPFFSVQKHETPLARFIHQYLIDTWLNATVGTPKKLFVNDVFNAFGKRHLTMNVKRRDMRAALSLLVSAGWFENVPVSKKMTNNGLIDYYYALIPTEVFVDDIVRANAKKKGLRMLEDSHVKEISKAKK
jgi:hypothetical protein